MSQSQQPQLDAQQQEVMMLGFQDVRNQALNACYDRYAFPGKVVGALVALAGGAVLQVFIPGFGQWIGISAGLFIAKVVDDMAFKEGEQIESWNAQVIGRYLDSKSQEQILLPYVEKAESLGKLPPQATTTGQTTKISQPSEPSANSQMGNGTSTSDQTAGSPASQTKPTPVDIRELLPELLKWDGAIRLIGAQGTGKTTFLKWLISQYPVAAIALDPHAAKGAYPDDITVVGGGMDYAAIDEHLKAVLRLVKERYVLIHEEGEQKFPGLLVVGEEMTNWGKKVESASDFIFPAFSDFRKVGVKLVYISHTDTLSAQGGKKGAADLIKKGSIKITLKARGEGVVEIPEKEPVEVSIPLMEPQKVSRPSPPYSVDDTQDYPDKPWDKSDRVIVTPPPKKEPLEVVIVRYLSKQPDPKAAWEIRNNCTQASDANRPTTDQVKELIDSFPDAPIEGHRIVAVDGKYTVTGTSTLGS